MGRKREDLRRNNFVLSNICSKAPLAGEELFIEVLK
jgi:hypothetical protein